MKADIQEDNDVEVQMAPLIDCVFLLLIFFLVATTLKKIDEELPLVLPQSAACVDVQQPDGYSVIAIDMNGAFYIDGTPVSLNLLQADLRNKARTNPHMKLRVDVHNQVEFQRVVQLLDIFKFEGLDNVSFNTKRAKGQFGY